MEAIATTLGLNVPGLIWHAINFIVLLVLLRLVRGATAKPIWRAYLPEVPPA